MQSNKLLVRSGTQVLVDSVGVGVRCLAVSCVCRHRAGVGVSRRGPTWAPGWPGCLGLSAMALRGRGPAIQVMPSYTQQELLKETGRLLQMSKQLREQVCEHWEISNAAWDKTPADSEAAVRQYTRWTVTGPAMKQIPGRAGSGGISSKQDTWKETKQVRELSLALFMQYADARRVTCVRAAGFLTPHWDNDIRTQALFGSTHPEPLPTTSVPGLPAPTAAASAAAAAPAPQQVIPQVTCGMYMAVITGAKVRAGASTTSDAVGNLEDGQVIEVLDTRKAGANGQVRVRFDANETLGLAGWVSSVTSSTGRAVLRQVEGPVWPTPGQVCTVVNNKATVREDFAMDSNDAGYLQKGDSITVIESRVNAQNQIRVAFEIEDVDHLGWVSMVASNGDILMEVVSDDWQMALDVDGDGQITAEEQARWEAYAAADVDGDGQVTASEMRQMANQRNHTHAHGVAKSLHDDSLYGSTIYGD